MNATGRVLYFFRFSGCSSRERNYDIYRHWSNLSYITLPVSYNPGQKLGHFALLPTYGVFCPPLPPHPQHNVDVIHGKLTVYSSISLRERVSKN